MIKDLCFEIIQTCPNSCKFCSSNSSKDKQTFISFEQFKKVINHFINQGGIEEISISGGEPFLHPDLFNMVKFCKENKIKTVIFTSGIKRSKNLTEDLKMEITKKWKKDLDKIEEVEPWNQKLKNSINKYYRNLLCPNEFTSITTKELEEFKEIGLNKIVFDCQTVNEEIDRELMGRKKLITKLFDSMVRASAVGLEVDVHFIPMKPNYKQFPDLIECLNIAEIKNISILNFIPQGRAWKNKEELMLNKEELEEFSIILNKEKEKFKGKIRIGIPLNGKISHLCTAGTEKLDIKYDGTVLPCPAFKEMDIKKMDKYGIKLYNIYEDLNEIIINEGKRAEPLCKKIYGFDNDLVK